MALSDFEFNNLANNPDSVPKIDLLIAILDKLRDDFGFLATDLTAHGLASTLYGKVYLEDDADYGNELFQEDDPRIDMLEAIQILPRNCNLREVVIQIDECEKGSDTKVTIDYSSILKLKNHGYEVFISAEVIEHMDDIFSEDVDTKFSPLPMVNIFVGDLLISF